MKTTIVLVAALLFAASAAAQQYKWVDKDGRVRYGDVPPPGVKATPLRAPPGPSSSASAPAAKDAKGAPKGPLTPAQQEAEFRKRQMEAEKARDKEARAAEEARAKKENCDNSQAQLRLLESGERIVRTDAKGERYYVEDEQRKGEIVRMRKQVSDWCGG
jgi:hypothetical protein